MNDKSKAMSRESWQFMIDTATVWLTMLELRDKGLIQGPDHDRDILRKTIEVCNSKGFTASAEGIEKMTRLAARGPLPVIVGSIEGYEIQEETP